MLWTPFSPFLTSGHQTISCIWAWFIYSLSEMPAERFMSSMSLKSASCTPGCHPNSCCSWVKRENEIWLQVITLHIKMLHHTWFWGLTCHLLKLIISSRTNMITNFSKTDWKHADNWYLKKEKKKTSEVIPQRKKKFIVATVVVIVVLLSSHFIRYFT